MSGVAGRVMLMLGRRRPSAGGRPRTESPPPSPSTRGAAIACCLAGSIPPWPLLAGRTGRRSSRRITARPPRRPVLRWCSQRQPTSSASCITFATTACHSSIVPVTTCRVGQWTSWTGETRSTCSSEPRSETGSARPRNLVGWVPCMTLAARVGRSGRRSRGSSRGDRPRRPPPVVEEPIALEALLEAVAARRLALREPPPGGSVEVIPPSSAQAQGRGIALRSAADIDAATATTAEGDARRGDLARAFEGRGEVLGRTRARSGAPVEPRLRGRRRVRRRDRTVVGG